VPLRSGFLWAWGRPQPSHLVLQAVQAIQNFQILAARRLRLLLPDKGESPVLIKNRAVDSLERLETLPPGIPIPTVC
jgi:hypothetical protein